MTNHNDIDYWKAERAKAWDNYFYWDAKIKPGLSKSEADRLRKQRKQAIHEAQKYDGRLQKALFDNGF